MFRTFALTLTLGMLTGSALAQDAPPQARAELSRQIKAYQDAQDCKGITGLFYTEGVDKDRLKSFSKTIQDFLCANFRHKINSIAFQTIDPAKVKPPGDFNGTHSAYTLPPVGVVVIDYGYGAPSETKSLSFLYGMHDDKAYLITTRQADTK